MSENPQDKSLTIFVLFFLMLFFTIILSAQERLSHEVSVDAVLAPLFAVDASGNPVYDLKQEEFEVFVNNKPVEIIYFARHEFKYEMEGRSKVAVDHDEIPVFESPGRVIFIIIDSVFNSGAGVKRSKKIALELIKQGSREDRFIIIEYSPGSGLKHIAGPGEDREQLIKKVKKIVPKPSNWMKKLHDTNDLTNIEGDRSYRSTIRNTSKRLENMRYKNGVRRFAYVLSRFKYALKTISKPKIVFLISEGVSKGAFGEPVDPNDAEKGIFIKTHLFSYLQKIIKAVNQGGSVLYTINPQSITKSVDRGASGDMSLSFLAGESGGKYFSGSDTGKIIKRIKKTTAAYYELAFPVNSELGEQLRLTIKCKRKDVRVHTLNHSERNRPYHLMEPVQKKILALNVATGGGWSRMLGTVTKAAFKIIKKEKTQYSFTVELPMEMKNRNLDVCLLYINPATEAVDMTFETVTAAESLELKINRKKNKKQFFVIIEPNTPHCIYNEI